MKTFSEDEIYSIKRLIGGNVETVINQLEQEIRLRDMYISRVEYELAQLKAKCKREILL